MENYCFLDPKKMRFYIYSENTYKAHYIEVQGADEFMLIICEYIAYIIIRGKRKLRQYYF
jgi:hypothetical protein